MSETCEISLDIILQMQETLGALKEAQQEALRQRQAQLHAIDDIRSSQSLLASQVQEVLALARSVASIPIIENRLTKVEADQSAHEEKIEQITPVVYRLRDESLRRKGAMVAAATGGGAIATAAPWLWKAIVAMFSHGG